MEDPKSARGSSRGGGQQRGGSRGRGQKRKREMGRGEWNRNSGNKRARHEDQRSGRRGHEGVGERDLPIYATKYSAEEIAAQERKPKRKVAVMIGYSGTGYKGMQLNHHEKTIEGDLFQAFVSAGAISKANADDPKKSSLVRCARTDKGVHAAGNVISLKLVIEDPAIVSKINEALPPQIRVWGIERTNASFSAYQLCDSRIYEYLIPTYCFLPPHPESFLGKKVVELAEKEGDLQGLNDRQEEVADFWPDTYEKHLNAIIEAIEASIKDEVLKRFLHLSHFNAADGVSVKSPPDSTSRKPDGSSLDRQPTKVEDETPNRDGPGEPIGSLTPKEPLMNDSETENAVPASDQESVKTVQISRPANFFEGENPRKTESGETEVSVTAENKQSSSERTHPHNPPKGPFDEIDRQVRNLKAALATAKRSWRIPQKRLDRVRSIFSRYVGSIKFHNYTIDKSWSEASATRVIKSFKVDDQPIIIGNTEWLSLKVHGQSFMMHQIRKMVSSAALIVRCGCHEGRIQDTFLDSRVSIPKAPSLGLLLERPVFDKYNDKLIEFGREPIDFGRYEKEVSEFKQREIYERIFRDEEKDSIFLAFFSALDSTRSASLLWLTSAGLQGTKTDINKDASDDIGVGDDIAKVEEDDSDVAEDS